MTGAFDVYLNICRHIKTQLSVALKRDTPQWRLQNACPPCTYVLHDEPPSQLSMLIAMDGNESLKRRRRAIHNTDASGKVISSQNIDQLDLRHITSDMYMMNHEVDLFKNEVKRCRQAISPEVSQIILLTGFLPIVSYTG